MTKAGRELLFFTPLAVACLASAFVVSRAQTSDTQDEPMSTVEHVQQPGWWPTKGTPPRGEYVGTPECAGCHPSEASIQITTPMAHAYCRPADSKILRERHRISSRLDNYLYEIKVTDAGYLYSVSEGARSTSSVLRAAFGDGRVGQTYVFEQEGVFYESNVSFFRALRGLDFSPGHPRSVQDLEHALGRPMDPKEARRCFGCHTTASATGGQFDPDNLIPGVTCEACHGPGAKHVSAMKAGRIEEGLEAILNPAKLKPVALVDFCGACHRTWADVAETGTSGVSTVRFPAYRLENSRCWGDGDERITCLACHDPHQPLVHEPGWYDDRCLRCHVLAAGSKASADHPGRACPKSSKDCVTCHMPKFEVPTTHGEYTDHWIRVVSDPLHAN